MRDVKGHFEQQKKYFSFRADQMTALQGIICKYINIE